MDSSVRVSHLDREVILMLLKARGWVQKDYKTPVLMNILAKVLKNRHAIHDELKMLSNSQLAGLCREFSLSVRGQKYRPRMMKAISSYFFEEYPDAPLTNLQRILVSTGWRPKPVQWRLLGGGKPKKKVGSTTKAQDRETKAQESRDGNYYFFFVKLALT